MVDLEFDLFIVTLSLWFIISFGFRYSSRVRIQLLNKIGSGSKDLVFVWRDPTLLAVVYIGYSCTWIAPTRNRRELDRLGGGPAHGGGSTWVWRRAFVRQAPRHSGGDVRPLPVWVCGLPVWWGHQGHWFPPPEIPEIGNKDVSRLNLTELESVLFNGWRTRVCTPMETDSSDPYFLVCLIYCLLA